MLLSEKKLMGREEVGKLGRVEREETVVSMYYMREELISMKKRRRILRKWREKEVFIFKQIYRTSK